MSQAQALSEWISQIDQYQQFNSDGKKIGTDLSRINELLPINSSARKKLNTGTHDGNTQARINCLDLIGKITITQKYKTLK